jgi:uncharacterized protein YbjT (DUF2867 family)
LQGVPVIVTGASGLIGREAVEAFASASPQVRAYVRRPEAAEALRALGAKAAVGSIEDWGKLETVMAGAHTVCHLVGGLIPRLPEDYEHAIVGSLRSVIEAAGRAGVERLLYVSYPGASPDAANPYIRAKGQAEELIRGSGLEHVIVRSTLVYGRAGPWLSLATRLARRHPTLVIGSGRQLLAPVYVGDVAAVLARADDRDRVESGAWGLEGPDRVTADDLADLLAGRRGRKVHLSPRAASRASRWSGPTVPRAALEVMAGDSLADAPDASAEFGVRPRSLREGLARSAERGPE